jgi:hypothetical protein
MNLAGQLPAHVRQDQPDRLRIDLKRMYNVEETVSVQHELMGRLGDRAAGTTASTSTCAAASTPGVSLNDFTPFTLYSPIDGSEITYYKRERAKASQLTTNLVDQNAPDRTMKYNGFEYNFSARSAEEHSPCSAAA